MLFFARLYGVQGHLGWSAESTAKSKTSSSGGTPSELEDPGLSWSRQATQDALERRKDEQRTTQRLKKLGFEEKVKGKCVDSSR